MKKLIYCCDKCLENYKPLGIIIREKEDEVIMIRHLVTDDFGNYTFNLEEFVITGKIVGSLCEDCLNKIARKSSWIHSSQLANKTL